jgi:hypothetical protein
MQTTLRINDELYREAKAKAAREGVTITRFIEEALRLRLRQQANSPKSGPVELPTFASGNGFPFSPEELKALAREADANADRGKLSRSKNRGRQRLAPVRR